MNAAEGATAGRFDEPLGDCGTWSSRPLFVPLGDVEAGMVSWAGENGVVHKVNLPVEDVRMGVPSYVRCFAQDSRNEQLVSQGH